MEEGKDMSEFNQSKYINEFIKETYDTIKIQIPKGQKEIIKEHAKKKGYKSVNEYMKYLISKDIKEINEFNIRTNKGIVAGNIHGDINMK